MGWLLMNKNHEYQTLTYRCLEQRLEKVYQNNADQISHELFSTICSTVLPEVWGGPDVQPPAPKQKPRARPSMPKIAQVFGIQVSAVEDDSEDFK